MNDDDSIRLNSLEDFDVSFSDLNDSFADPDFILETVNNLSDSEFIFEINDGLYDRDDLGVFYVWTLMMNAKKKVRWSRYNRSH